jgi:predicted protein tyrosine phosphatase
MVLVVVVIITFIAMWPSEGLVIAGLSTVPRHGAFAIAVLVALTLAVRALPVSALALRALPLHPLPCGPNMFVLALAHTLLLLQGTLAELPLLLSLMFCRPVCVDVAAPAVVIVHARVLGQARGEV